jgi:hypothetical protein
MSRWTLALLLAASCRRPTPPAEPPPAVTPAQPEAVAVPIPPGLELLNWSTVADAAGPVVQLRQTATARDRCHVEVTVGGERRWSIDACVATRLQLRFLSPDGERALVLDPSPEVAGGQPLDLTSLGRLWRHGAVAIDLTPAALSLHPGALRVEAGVVRWLGERDQRVSAQGVEVQLADGSSRLLRFDGADLKAPPAQPQQGAPRARAACNPCSYTDGQGVYHMVENADEIPARFRNHATQVRAVENRADATPASNAIAPAASARAPESVEPNQFPTRKELEAFAEQELERSKAQREANYPPQELTHFERVQQLVDPMHLGDPYRDNNAKIHCVDPGGKEIPCPN